MVYHLTVKMHQLIVTNIACRPAIAHEWRFNLHQSAAAALTLHLQESG